MIFILWGKTSARSQDAFNLALTGQTRVKGPAHMHCMCIVEKKSGEGQTINMEAMALRTACAMRTVPVNLFETAGTLRSLASGIVVNSFTVGSTAVIFRDPKKMDPKVGTLSTMLVEQLPAATAKMPGAVSAIPKILPIPESLGRIVGFGGDTRGSIT